MQARRIFGWLGAVGCVALASAQGGHGEPPERSKIVGYPEFTIIDKIGSSDLPITTVNPEARKLVQQGLALVHCFWFNEAVRSFRDATRKDPSCAMAWCGLNIALTLPWHNPGNAKAEATDAIQRAMLLSGDCTPIEQELIANYRFRSVNGGERGSDFEKAMLRLIDKFPEIDEPRMLVSAIRAQICLGDGYDDQGDLQGEMKLVSELIDPVLKRHPDTAGALHYRIHANERSDPQRALDAAHRLEKAAAASAHMVHMPGHIYHRVGLYAEADRVFKESMVLDEKYAESLGVTPFQADWNYPHNIDFMVANLIEMGRVKESLEMSKKISSNGNNSRWRAGQFDVLAEPMKERAEQPGATLSNYEWYIVGMNAAHSGNTEMASRASQALEAKVKDLPTPSGAKDWSRTSNLVTRTQWLEVKGMALSAAGKHDEAIGALKEAASTYAQIAYSEPPNYPRPAFESLGEGLIAAGRYDEAIQAYRDGLKYRPNSGWMQYGIALALEKQGKRREAQRAYQQFLKWWPTADEDLPQMVHAKTYMAGQSRR